MNGFRQGHIQANGIDFHYLEIGTGPLVLCLHGFPDNAFTYRYLGPALADAGFRVVAPFMRGYTPTGRPKDERYQSVLLAQDAVALIAALGCGECGCGGTRLGGAGDVRRRRVGT